MSYSKNVQFFDAVVIGGGPAGSAAAFTLASANLSTCLIDKSAFPRDKLCGGLVTQRSKKIFESVFRKQWRDNLVSASSDIRFCSNGKPLVTLSPIDHRTEMYFTMRIRFDAYLVDLASMAGASLKLGRKVDLIDIDRNRLALDNGEEIEFKYLIGADGVNSQVAKKLFGSSFNEATVGFGLEVEVPKEHLSVQKNVVEIDFAAARWGYGWIFPKDKTYTIGIGGIHRLNPDLKVQLASYLKIKDLDIKNYQVKGQYIPFGECRKHPGSGNVLLCGDAAGTVDPITGEGIAYAMQTGHAAGLAVVDAHTRLARDAMTMYSQSYGKVSRSINQARRWRYLIFPAPIMKTFAWAFADAGTLQRGYLDLLAGNAEYDDLPQMFIEQLRKGLRKLRRHLIS
jgi:geranylgeranyl reductase family protein